MENTNTNELEAVAYGISTKYNFGWEHYLVKFLSKEAAREWLNTEEYDFRTRELFFDYDEVVEELGEDADYEIAMAPFYEGYYSL